MTGRPRRLYVDASALVKLVITEAESDALLTYLGDDALLSSSRIAAVEVRRATDRQDERSAASTVDALLESVAFVELDPAVAAAAGGVLPRTLRSLDATHLASALALGGDLDALVTYDARLADAARAAGLEVVSPA